MFQLLLFSTQLAAMHYNENSGRQQATTASGELRWHIQYPRYRRGEHTLRPMKRNPTFGIFTQSICLCLSMFMSVYLSIYQSVCIYLSICLLLSVCLSVFTVYFCLSVSVYLCLCTSIYLSVSTGIYLFICLSLSLSIYPSIYIYHCKCASQKLRMSW